MVQPAHASRGLRIRHDRRNAIIILSTAIAMVIGGLELILSAIGAELIVLGYSSLLFGAIILMSITGIFGGAPHKGRGAWAANWADDVRRRRERKRHSD